MAVTRFPLPAGFGSAVFVSQSWNWLTKRWGGRWGWRPQVCLFFGEKSPRSVNTNGNFQDF